MTLREGAGCLAGSFANETARRVFFMRGRGIGNKLCQPGRSEDLGERGFG